MESIVKSDYTRLYERIDKEIDLYRKDKKKSRRNRIRTLFKEFQKLHQRIYTRVESFEKWLTRKKTLKRKTHH